LDCVREESGVDMHQAGSDADIRAAVQALERLKAAGPTVFERLREVSSNPASALAEVNDLLRAVQRFVRDTVPGSAELETTLLLAPVGVQALVAASREFVMSTLPEAREAIRFGALCYHRRSEASESTGKLCAWFRSDMAESH
jgi:ABC-type transporter Mla subunit MlaD